MGAAHTTMCNEGMVLVVHSEVSGGGSDSSNIKLSALIVRFNFHLIILAPTAHARAR